MTIQSSTVVTLPFTLSVTSSPKIPAFIDRAHNTSLYDAPFVNVEIDDELWVFQAECPIVDNYTPDTHVFYRWKGTNVDDVVRQADGKMDSSFPREEGQRHWIMGLWYDQPTRKLYACMHTEFNYTGTDCINGFNWCPRSIRLASSTDKGLAWHFEGEIITSEFPTGLLDFYKPAGSNKTNGCGDFDFVIDQAGEYAYIYWFSGSCGKGDHKNKPFVYRRYVARCKLTDKLVPGKWQKFFRGQWTEPGLGGRASFIFSNAAISDVAYNTYLKKYIAIIPGGNGVDKSAIFYQTHIATCTDLASQDWTRCAYLPQLDGKPIFSLINNADGRDQYTCGKTFQLYRFYGNEKSERLDVTLGEGETCATGMTPDYNYEPMVESADPIEGRQTRIVGSQSPETICKGGGWTPIENYLYFQGRTTASGVAGDSIEFSFQGDAIYWRAVKSPTAGKAQVFIDGHLETEVDLRRHVMMAYQFPFVKAGLGAGPHTIRIVVAGGGLVEHMAFEYTAESYKASAGFSSVQGVSHWFYRQRLEGRYKDLVFFAPDEKQFYNEWHGDGPIKIGPGYMVPGMIETVRKWAAPHDGKVRIEGKPALNESDEQGISARILKNDSEIWPVSVLKSPEPIAHDLTIAIKQGDAICFVANAHRASAFLKVFWDPVITYVD